MHAQYDKPRGAEIRGLRPLVFLVVELPARTKRKTAKAIIETGHDSEFLYGGREVINRTTRTISLIAKAHADNLEVWYLLVSNITRLTLFVVVESRAYT